MFVHDCTTISPIQNNFVFHIFGTTIILISKTDDGVSKYVFCIICNHKLSYPSYNKPTTKTCRIVLVTSHVLGRVALCGRRLGWQNNWIWPIKIKIALKRCDCGRGTPTPHHTICDADGTRTEYVCVFVAHSYTRPTMKNNGFHMSVCVCVWAPKRWVLVCSSHSRQCTSPAAQLWW